MPRLVALVQTAEVFMLHCKGRRPTFFMSAVAATTIGVYDWTDNYHVRLVA